MKPVGLKIRRYQLEAGEILPRRIAAASALTVVVEGSFEDLSHVGRFRVNAGSLIVRPSFGSRAAKAGSTGAVCMDFPWRVEIGLGGVYDGLDGPALSRRARIGVEQTLSAIMSELSQRPMRDPVIESWADELAQSIRANLHQSISAWARGRGLAAETVTRGFKNRHWVGPGRYRLELRARSAWTRILTSADPLSLIALECGFFDQAHMTRAVRWLTGVPPAEWRAVRRAAG